MTKIVVAEAERCMSCKSCEFACAAAHSEPARYPRIHVVPVAEAGLPVQCRHCPDAPCVKVCPKGALGQGQADGPVEFDSEACSGCGFCTLVCPFGAIDLLAEDKTIVKCDLCSGRAEGPACVAACPTAGLSLIEPDEVLRERLAPSRVAAELSPGQDGPADPDGKTARCRVCGRPWTRLRQLEVVRKKLGDALPVPNVCPQCRRLAAAVLLAGRECPTT